MGFPELFKGLADPVRREILELLKNGKMSAGDIAANFDIS
ncbi:MAG: helix-turn-helix domain-containing protein, partial [Oscillospiraceae bacterium]